MKKSQLLFSILLAIVSISFVSASCNLGVSLLNQDPYPAVQGEYVKLVFQVSGLQDPSCNNVYFELIDNYPISFDPGANPRVQVKGGTFTQDFKSTLTVPYKVRVDPDAIDGDNEITVRYGQLASGIDSYVKKFNISVEDARTTFEIFLKDYDPATQVMTLEILNTGKKNVEALTLEIKDPGNSIIKGPDTNVIGSLDSNDFTTADFDTELSNGSLDLEIKYTDDSGIRRTTNQTVPINVQPFLDKAQSQKSGFSIWTILIVVAGLVVAFYFYRRYKKKKMHHHH